jgi:hypothetical protein
MGVNLFHFQINDDTAAARRRRRGVLEYTLRKPTTTPTKVALDLELELWGATPLYINPVNVQTLTKVPAEGKGGTVKDRPKEACVQITFLSGGDLPDVG